MCLVSSLVPSKIPTVKLENLKNIHNLTRKMFRDDIFALWPHGRESLVLLLDYINTLDPTQKIKFTIEVAKPGNYLELLDLKLK